MSFTPAQTNRQYVFATLSGHDFRVDATILEKCKAQTQTRVTDERFYKTAWYLHMKYVAPIVARAGDRLLVVSASLGTKKKRSAMDDGARDVIKQVSPTIQVRTTSWNCFSDPCLQVADYCCWANARKWEAGDERSYNLIKTKIRSEFDVWRSGTVSYY